MDILFLFFSQPCQKYLCRVIFFKLESQFGASQVVLVLKNLPASAGDEREIGLALGLEDPLEEGMATHSSILAWRILWTEEPGRLQSIALQRVGHD